MRPYANPFNAGFGVDPPYLAGRDALVHRILADLRDGPGRAQYIKVVLGDRGVGKTRSRTAFATTSPTSSGGQPCAGRPA